MTWEREVMTTRKDVVCRGITPRMPGGEEEEGVRRQHVELDSPGCIATIATHQAHQQSSPFYRYPLAWSRWWRRPSPDLQRYGEW